MDPDPLLKALEKGQYFILEIRSLVSQQITEYKLCHLLQNIALISPVLSGWNGLITMCLPSAPHCL